MMKKIFFILFVESEEKYMPGSNKKKYLYRLSVDLYSSVKIMSDGDHKELIYVNKMKAKRAMITLLEKNAFIFRDNTDPHFVCRFFIITLMYFAKSFQADFCILS